MLDQWLNSLPKPLLVGLVLVVGIVMIIILRPPHSPCDDQIDLFRQQQTSHIFLDPAKSYKKTAEYTKSYEKCRIGINLGSCLDLFDNLRRLLRDLEPISETCAPDVGGLDEVKQSLWGTLGLMSDLAWGESGPGEPEGRLGWFDASQVFLYCRLKKTVKRFYSDEEWNDFVSKSTKALKGYSQLPQKEAWPRSLFSHPCQSF